MKRKLYLSILIVALLTMTLLFGCGIDKSIIDPKDIDVGYLEDNVAIIHLPKGDSGNHITQAIAFIVEDLRNKDKVITSISFIPFGELNSYCNYATDIYIVYTDK